MSISSDIQLLAPSAVVELFELDLTSLGGEKYYFHGGINSQGNNIVWKGITYTRYPIEAEGFEKTSTGTLPRPTLRAANIMGEVSALAYNFQDLVGGKIIRRRTFAKYLDAINFPGGINPYADPNVAFPDEVWSIDRKSAENPVFVEFELAAAFDVIGIMLPRRQCIQNTCTWKYRSAECGYTGGAAATKNDVPTADLTQDVCGKRLSSCKMRFGITGQLPYGGFPGVGLIR
jgi:lambda family phage minor tail protein L